MYFQLIEDQIGLWIRIKNIIRRHNDRNLRIRSLADLQPGFDTTGSIGQDWDNVIQTSNFEEIPVYLQPSQQQQYQERLR